MWGASPSSKAPVVPPSPVVGAPSASAVSHGGTLHRRASYHVYTVRKADDRYVIEAKERGLTEAGAIADLRVLQLTRR